MQFFRYTEDRIPVLIVTVFFAINIVVYFTVSNPWLLLLWTMVCIIPKGWISAWNHHHQHVMTFKQAWLNRLLEIPYGLMTGIIGHGWVLHHVVGHHINYLDQRKDESRWKTLSGRRMSELEYILVTTITAYPRCIQVGLKHPRHFRPFLMMAATILAILGAAFYYNPVGALFVWLLPMIISTAAVVWATYDHHSGLETDDHFRASYNVLDKWYNLATCNLGYHTAHHYRQAVHWSRLPQLHQEIESKIGLEFYKQPGVPFSWIYRIRALLGGKPVPDAVPPRLRSEPGVTPVESSLQDALESVLAPLGMNEDGAQVS